MYSTNNSLPWFESRQTCDLATPPYELFFGELKVNLKVNISKEHWIGYFKAVTGFEYIACIPFVEFKARITLPSMTQGLCYSACGKKPTFGIRSTTCYCEDEIGYDESLQFSSPVECVSIYKVNKDVVKNHPEGADKSKCMTFQTQPENKHQLSKLYKWTDCGQYFKLFCENVDIGSHNEVDNEWKESAEKCFNRSSHPLRYNDLQAKKMNFTGPVWTSLICSDVIYEYKEYDNRLPNIRFGYVKGTKTDAVLKFTSDDTQYKALCIGGQGRKTNTGPTKTSFSSASTKKSTSKYSDTSAQSSTTSMYSSSSLAIQVSSNRTSMKLYGEQNVGNEDGDSTVYVIVGASVGTLVAVGILAVTVVVIFRRRRSATPKISNTEHEVVYSNATSSDIPLHLAENASVPKPNADSSYSQAYGLGKENLTKSCTLDEKYDTTKAGVKNMSNPNDNIYNKLGADETYDITGPEKSAKFNESSNMYGKLNEDMENVYNTAGTETKNQIVSENIYNKGGKNIDETYDHVSNK
ncbi:uncharacterized protein LOC132717310 isoform X2 [Ruditapes philippinarum]|nr:uncharacterized protein LOC132717310 isoform X2 [Ruditapes philippinarum]